MNRYGFYKFDNNTFVVFDHVEEREICVCSNYDDWTDAEHRAKNIVKALNALIIDYPKELTKFSVAKTLDFEKRNHYIFLTDQGLTFEPNSEDEEREIENLQVIGFADGVNADEAYRNLRYENPYLKETNFERIFCYPLDKDYDQNRKDYNLRVT
jgi:hypothetical protein